MTTAAPPPGDVGGWFRTANGSVTLSTRWAPRPGDYGRTSPDDQVQTALELFRGRRTVVLTGAGMSTGSGLPDYRGRDAVERSPMTFQEFTSHDVSRRRYWARSTVGWQWFEAAVPNTAHYALAELARHTPITAVITQNVDGLHQRAGSDPVIELHGSLAKVICLGCGQISCRVELQKQLLAGNPDWVARLSELSNQARTAPDGDAEVDRTETFRYPTCDNCGGMLKPDVVFFGENAHPDVVATAYHHVEAAEALMVLGSSLSVMSGLRFVRRAAKDGKPVVIVGDGPTRGDELATIRLHGRLENIVPRWVSLLS